MAEDCCRAPMGADKKLFDDLASALARLEARGSDKVLMDLTISTKRSTYEKLILQADRLRALL